MKIDYKNCSMCEKENTDLCNQETVERPILGDDKNVAIVCLNFEQKTNNEVYTARNSRR